MSDRKSLQKICIENLCASTYILVFAVRRKLNWALLVLFCVPFHFDYNLIGIKNCIRFETDYQVILYSIIVRLDHKSIVKRASEEK